MALGTAPQRLVDLLETEWQASRTGRADVPEMIQYQTGSDDPALNSGVLVLRDREDPAVDMGKHDLIHCYHPEANPPNSQDRGYSEEQLVETVQIDIDITDRTDHSLPAGQQRLSARKRMVGLRGDLTDFDEPPYPGLLGETKYILETVRRGLDEWDTVSHDFVLLSLKNSNATASINVELEQIARNTVQ